MLLAGDMMQRDNMTVADDEQDLPYNQDYRDDPTTLSASFQPTSNIWATGPDLGMAGFNSYQSCQDNSINTMNDLEIEDAVIGPDTFWDNDVTMLEISHANYPTYSYSQGQDQSMLCTGSAAAFPQALYNRSLVSNGLPAGHMPVVDTPMIQNNFLPEYTTTSTHAGHFLQPGSSDIPLHPAQTLPCNVQLGVYQVSELPGQDHILYQTPFHSVPGNSTASPRRRHVTAEDWIANRDLFTRLYRDENKTLKEVMSIIETSYGFHATEKMYKSRIREWHLEKNIKAAEKEEIRQHEQRNSGLQLGRPMLNGKPVPKQRLDRYDRDRRRDRSDRKRIFKEAFESNLALSFERISDPNEYRESQIVFKCLEDYYDSKLEGDSIGAWKAWKNASNPSSGSPSISYTFYGRVYSRKLPRAFDVFNSFTTGARELRRKRHYRGWRLITEGFELMRSCLQREDHTFISGLFQLICARVFRSCPELLAKILNHIAELSKIVYPENHPISLVGQLLAGSAARSSIVRPGFQKISDILQTRLGAANEWSLICLMSLCGSLRQQKKYEEEEHVLQQYNDLCGRGRGPHDFYVRAGILELGILRSGQGRTAEALDAITDVLHRGKASGSRDVVNIDASRLLSLLYEADGNLVAAESVSWSAVYGHILGFGTRDPLSIKWLGEYQRLVQKLEASQKCDRAKSDSKNGYFGKLPVARRCTSKPRSNSRPSEGRLQRRYARFQQAERTHYRLLNEEAVRRHSRVQPIGR